MRRFSFFPNHLDKHSSFNTDGQDPEMLNDEEARVNKNDPCKNFVPIEEVPDEVPDEVLDFVGTEEVWSEEIPTTTDTDRVSVVKNGRGRRKVAAVCSPNEIVVFQGVLENGSKKIKARFEFESLPFFQGFGRRIQKKQ